MVFYPHDAMLARV